MWRSAVQLCAGLQGQTPRNEFKINNSQFKIMNYELSIVNWNPGGLAQLARATALQAVGQRFDSVILHE